MIENKLCFQLSALSSKGPSSNFGLISIFFGQGEAKSAQLIGQAIANKAFITLRKIEGAREIASTMAHSSNKVMLSADNLLFNIQEMNLENK
ncbi:prohibitin-1, mitochondrial [Artemisia annua]|uniref:Prohibitin n=1 Tax=Artemisia annua TaxID=35608 RepID=A0A2U1M895_ARTAN|nr:prohibitin-1, mitochondrial [Artemisia annua]